MQLRPYQEETIASHVAFAKKGVKRQLVCLPTASGKTVIFAELPRITGGRPILVIAHRTELLKQAKEKIKAANPDAVVAIEQAGKKAPRGADIIIGSIQTLGLASKPKDGQERSYTLARLETLDPDRFGVIVIDEAHHAVAKSYLRLLYRFGLAPDPDIIKNYSLNARELNVVVKQHFENFKVADGAPYLFGYTATPHRTDGLGLENVFDEMVYSKTMLEMMKEGWLADVQGYQIATLADISQVKMSHGDYKDSELSEAVNQAHRNETVVNAYLAHAPGRRTLCFCVDVAHTYAMAEEFQRAGVRVGLVVGNTPSDLRGDIIAAYQGGEIEVLCNCMVLTEGFDAPETDCIIMARPTTSSLLYTQMLGRGTRKAPGKENLLVLDMVDVGSNGVPTLNTLFGLPPKLALSGQESVLSVQAMVSDILGDDVDPAQLTDAYTVEDVRRMAVAYSPLAAATLPEWLQCDLAWIRTSYGYAVSLKGTGTIGIVTNMLGQGTVRLKKRYQPTQTLADKLPEQQAIIFAEKWAKENCEDYNFMRKNASWRTRGSLTEATEAQAKFAKKLKVDLPEKCSKSDATTLIEMALAKAV